MAPLLRVCQVITVAAVLLAAVNALPSGRKESPTCAESCKCLGPWAKCSKGSFGNLHGHLGPGIQTVSFLHYNISVLQTKSFSKLNLQDIWKLEINYCGITSVKRNAFVGLNSLLSLYLDHNKIESVEPGAFSGLIKLTHIDLSDNSLKVLKPGTFQGLSKLKIIHLNSNQLTLFSSEMFLGTRDLFNVRVEENQIESIDVKNPELFKHLKSVDVKNNPLNCNCKLKRVWNKYKLFFEDAVCANPKEMSSKNWNILLNLNCEYDSL